jgi:hypothetical protein
MDLQLPLAFTQATRAKERALWRWVLMQGRQAKRLTQLPLGIKQVSYIKAQVQWQ